MVSSGDSLGSSTCLNVASVVGEGDRWVKECTHDANEVWGSDSSSGLRTEGLKAVLFEGSVAAACCICPFRGDSNASQFSPDGNGAVRRPKVGEQGILRRPVSLTATNTPLCIIFPADAADGRVRDHARRPGKTRCNVDDLAPVVGQDLDVDLSLK